MRFMMLIHHDEAALKAAPQKELGAEYGAFNEALAKAAGCAPGERLQPSSAATTVRQHDGKTDDDVIPELADEAIWLGRLLVSLLPDEPEAKGMLALMLYAEARRPARRDATGAFVPLEQQDPALWNNSQIALAEKLLREGSQSGPTGRYQLEAAIQSAHTARRITGAANWPIVVKLYDHLLALTNSPVVVLNRAVALAEVEGAGAAVSAIAPLAGDKRMLGYQPYWAVRGHLLARSGGVTAAATKAFTVAIGLTTDPAVRAYLRGQLAGLKQNSTDQLD